MHAVRSLIPLALLAAALLVPARPAEAVSPRNPYSSFNLSGVNYGAMQWERAQRQGKRVWPSYNTPSRGGSRGSAVSIGGVGNGGFAGGTYRTTSRRWRR
ncbi:MAG: hypothetical protein WCO99_00960 [Planctomycetota bacterium]